MRMVEGGESGGWREENREGRGRRMRRVEGGE